MSCRGFLSPVCGISVRKEDSPVYLCVCVCVCVLCVLCVFSQVYFSRSEVTGES